MPFVFYTLLPQTNHKIRRVSLSNNEVITIAGGGSKSEVGLADGIGSNALYSGTNGKLLGLFVSSLLLSFSTVFIVCNMLILLQ